ncbi:MAG TPA: carboxypeptidase-like regulatory domain-containing protein, partial [Chloroflexota bacterium]|nr:carboxypeptidase-like regulatory domain-containing protein [Chloroflexota bacterium]
TPSPSFRVAPDAPPAVVKLVPGGVVRGHIADDQGVPLENFSVQLFRRTPGSSEPTRQSFFTIVTNDLGNFRIPDLPAGSYYLVVVPQEVHAYRRGTDEIPTGYPRVFYPGVPDFSSANPIKVSAGRESIANFALAAKPFVRLSGKVSGYPPGSSVDLAFGRDLQTDSAQSINLDRRTGAFQTDWIPPGDYLLVAGAEPDSSSSQSAALMAYLPVTAASSVSGLNVVLLPGVNVPVNIEGLTRNEDLAQFVVQVSLKGATNSIQAAEVLPKESAPNLPAADMYFLSIPQGTYHIDVSSTADDPYYVESARSGSTDLLASDLVVDSSTAAHPVEIVVRHG